LIFSFAAETPADENRSAALRRVFLLPAGRVFFETPPLSRRFKKDRSLCFLRDFAVRTPCLMVRSILCLNRCDRVSRHDYKPLGREDNMQHRAGFYFSWLILFLALLNISCTGAHSELKTIKLAGGGEVPDIRGDWVVDYEYYGIYRALSGYSNAVRIFQDENKFVAVVKIQDQFFSRGTEVMRGELFKDGFTSAQLFTKDRGWLDCAGTITDNGNKIVFDEATQKRTLTRER
jgi:hypothetical protein